MREREAENCAPPGRKGKSLFERFESIFVIIGFPPLTCGEVQNNLEGKVILAGGFLGRLKCKDWGDN